jgi:hypothetical protein
METKLRTIHVDKTSRYDMQTEHAEKLCTRNHAEEIHVCRLNPHTNYTTRRCRQIMQAEKQKEHADKRTKRADRTSGQVMQTEHAHFAQSFSNFCNIYAEPSQVCLFFNSSKQILIQICRYSKAQVAYKYINGQYVQKRKHGLQATLLMD